ncbi:TPA: hypothetical protein I7787_21040 [Vibrio vulnificus]|nr:hypothetical protein [Vibrio vulnificus]ELH3492604.1 hypothetical protein [Vibrio vulnificus]HAS8618178.1 hypothetical protein [Vibrio vulnificus]
MSTRISKFEDFSSELQTKKTCPFTKKSLDIGSFETIDLTIELDLNKIILCCINEAEKIRNKINTFGLGKLYTSNIILSEKITQTDLDWLHWILKVMYTNESLMFGKFHKEKKEKLRNGQTMIVPETFISIREFVPQKDPKLLVHKAQDIPTNTIVKLNTHYASIIETSSPSSVDVLFHHFGFRLDEVNSSLPNNFYQTLQENSAIYIQKILSVNTQDKQ